MSRNIDKANEAIFYNIKVHYHYFLNNEDNGYDASLDEKRFVGGSKEEADYFKYLKIDLDSRLSFSDDKLLVFAHYNENKFLISVGLGDVITPEGIEPYDLNAGIFAAVVSDLDLMPNHHISSNRISNDILSQYVGLEDYKGHSYQELEPIFPKIKIYTINENIYAGDISSIEQLVCLILASNKCLLKLKYSETTLETFRHLFYKNYSSLKYDTLFQALTSNSFKFAFLDIYRAIEMLYQICYIADVESELNNVSREDLLKYLDSALNCKPNERNSLIKIINSILPSDRNYISTRIRNIVGRFKQGNTVSDESIWNWIYDLRCSIVHLKTHHQTYHLSDREWDMLIYCLLVLIMSAYTLYNC